MIKFKVSKAPYETNKILYKYDELVLQDKGTYILIGRNGIGKTTLLSEIQDYCKRDGIPFYSYDNYREGGNNAMQGYLFRDELSLLASSAFHSEGEQIYNNFAVMCGKIGSFVRKVKEKGADIPIVIALDAIDSGLDVLGLERVKQVCDMIIEDYPNSYILITANNYGLIHKQRCLDVRTGKIVSFEDYETYEKYIKAQWNNKKR